MEEKELKAKDIPMGYELCFNSGCADNDTCMHYQAMLLTSADRYKGQAVFPVAWQSGTDILQIVAQFGSLDGIKFDGYKIEWDFD